MHPVTPGRVAIILLVYLSLFCVIWTYKHAIAGDERKTYTFIGIVWAISVFIAN